MNSFSRLTYEYWFLGYRDIGRPRRRHFPDKKHHLKCKELRTFFKNRKPKLSITMNILFWQIFYNNVRSVDILEGATFRDSVAS